ncbi:bactofilin family protein [Pseudogemmobacter sp. W21_MBD1_M6]|uniref:bactofilin family protein n=1 Tax=Pseudogemmobacter sp. W21_MBD1_M6 TaxID=3240271 RepID=UPI003F998945
MFKKPAPSPAADAMSNNKDRKRSMIHSGITIDGNLTCDGILDLDCLITGDVTADTLVLGSQGQINGNVRARHVTIDGRLVGTVSAVNVALKPSARVTADIRYERLSIDSGAQIEGALSKTTQPAIGT